MKLVKTAESIPAKADDEEVADGQFTSAMLKKLLAYKRGFGPDNIALVEPDWNATKRDDVLKIRIISLPFNSSSVGLIDAEKTLAQTEKLADAIKAAVAYVKANQAKAWETLDAIHNAKEA